MLGTHAAPLYGLTPAELDLWLGEAREHGRCEHEKPCSRPDGSSFIGTTIIRPLVDDGAAAAGFVVVTRDITDQRRFEEHFRHLQKMEAIGQLAGGVAHDFNNLLTAIVGYADWLKQDLHDDPRQPHADRILSSAMRGAELTRQLLAFSRRQMPSVAPLNISHVIASMLPVLQRVLGERISVVDRTDPFISPVMGDRSQIEQVILNLVVNARDAMPDRGMLTIRTQNLRHGASQTPGILAAGDYVVLEVSDTGIGMDDATRQRVFEPFFTTKEVGRGTGLGLAMVYGIVQQMAGAVQVESQPGRGSTFRLWFPRATASASTTEAAAGTRASAVAHGHETLLVVEDETAVRHYLKHVLEANGYRVLIAEHPARAISLLEERDQRVDLLISDVVMPGTSGPDLARRLQRERPGVGVLFISGYTGNALATSVRDLTSTHFLSKPFSRNELLAKVREILSAAAA
jgi:two-component system cell cycle sensor histidine kinase/response regulator CckA